MRCGQYGLGQIAGLPDSKPVLSFGLYVSDWVAEGTEEATENWSQMHSYKASI